MASTFPASLDNIVQFANLTTSDAALVTQFQTYMETGNFTSAATVFAQIPNANTKFVSAARLNQLIDALLAVEQFYGTDIEPYVTSKQAEWQAIIDQFSYIATFSSTTQYRKNNIVTYTITDGTALLYICTVDNPPIGTVPTNTSYWRALTIQGQTGASGGNFSFRYNWSSTATYYANDVVVYNNAWWAATSQNTNVTPVVGATSWTQVLYVGRTIYPISATQPTSQAIGELWFQVV